MIKSQSLIISHREILDILLLFHVIFIIVSVFGRRPTDQLAVNYHDTLISASATLAETSTDEPVLSSDADLPL